MKSLALAMMLALGLACNSDVTRPTKDASFGTPIDGDVFVRGQVVTVRWISMGVSSVRIEAELVAGGRHQFREIVCDAPSSETGGAWPWDTRSFETGVYELTIHDGGFACGSLSTNRGYNSVRIFLVKR